MPTRLEAPPERPLRPGQYVRVRSTAESRWAGRTGLVVAADERQAVVRFSAVRSHPFALIDLVKVIDAVRAG